MTFRCKQTLSFYNFLVMRKNIDKLIIDLEEDKECLEVVSSNMKNLDFILNKIVFFQNHSLNLMFKDAIILKRDEILDNDTINRGLSVLHTLMRNAIEIMIKDGPIDLQGLFNKVVTREMPTPIFQNKLTL